MIIKKLDYPSSSQTGTGFPRPSSLPHSPPLVTDPDEPVIGDGDRSFFGFDLDVIGIKAENPVSPDATHVTRGTPVDVTDLHLGKPVLRVMVETEEHLPAFPHTVFPYAIAPEIPLPTTGGKEQGGEYPGYASP